MELLLAQDRDMEIYASREALPKAKEGLHLKEEGFLGNPSGKRNVPDPAYRMVEGMGRPGGPHPPGIPGFHEKGIRDDDCLPARQRDPEGRPG